MRSVARRATTKHPETQPATCACCKGLRPDHSGGTIAPSKPPKDFLPALEADWDAYKVAVATYALAVEKIVGPSANEPTDYDNDPKANATMRARRFSFEVDKAGMGLASPDAAP